MQKIQKTRLLGIILFFSGTVVSIAAAAKVPAAGQEYSSTIGIFMAGLGWAIIGNILWRRTEKTIVKARLEEHKNDKKNNPLMMLKNTVAVLESLCNKAQNLQGMPLCQEVDIVLNENVHPFTEKRKTFVDILGQAKGAEILLDIAYGERMLNRVWSAASDGHHQEALNSLNESLFNYKKALAKL